MNVLAKVLGIGPLKLLYNGSLRHECTVSVNQNMVTQTRTQTIKKWQKWKTSCDMAHILHLQVLDRSRVLSFATLPISLGICPVSLLSCSRMGQETPPNNKKKEH